MSFIRLFRAGISVLNTTSLGDANVETYTIFRTEGVVIHSTHDRNPLGLGPFGVIEMGYCN